MTTIQDRIIKKYHQIFKGTVMWQEHESFLRDSIKEVEEETRKEVLEDVIIKANNCFVTPKEDNEIQFVDIELFLCFIKHLQSLKREIILSITNKEKEK